MYYFVKLLLHVSAPRNHLHGGHLQGNIFVINSVKDVHMRSYNALLANKFCYKCVKCRLITGALYLSVILCLTADIHPYQYCRLHSKGLIS